MVDLPDRFKNKDKLAVIKSGGGMRCSWGVGIVDGLIHIYMESNIQIS